MMNLIVFKEFTIDLRGKIHPSLFLITNLVSLKHSFCIQITVFVTKITV